MNTVAIREEIKSAKIIVVKTGSRIMTSQGNGDRVKNLAADIVALRAAGIRVALVSSGAIAHGMRALGMAKRPVTIPLQQACASVGQNRLMAMYQDAFEPYDALIGQVLLTWDDLRSKKRYLNLRNTMIQLFDNDVIPIINENDSVGVEEIRFGTNDILSAQVAMLIQADVLVNLTDVGGLFDRNPRLDPSARHIPVVSRMSEELHGLAADKKNEISVGGMSSKLKAVEIVTRAGIFALIGDGINDRLLNVIRDKHRATIFLPLRRKMSSHQRWIAFCGSSSGSLVVDEGARLAIVEKGKSLLPTGIREVHGSFKAGDAVDIRPLGGGTFARGLVNYSADQIRAIGGRKTSEIAARLGCKEFDEVIHRNNLVLI